MGGPSPWRASAGSFGLYVLVGGVFATLLWLNSGDLLPGVVIATATVLVLFPAELQAASRLSWRLGEFAGQVPGEPEPAVSWWGNQSLHWSDFGLTVSGGTYRFRITGLVAETEGRTWDVQFSRPREGARRVLDDLGEEPVLEDFDGRLPSVYPRLSGLKTGVLAALVAAIAVGLGGPVVGGSYPLWGLGLPVAVGGIVGGLRWAGLRSALAAARGICRGLSQGGLRVERVDRLEGLVRLTFALRTADGTGIVRSAAFPGGRIAVSHGDRERSAPAAEAEATGRELARWLAAGPKIDENGITAPPSPGDLTAAQRLLFATLGTGFLAICGLAVGITRPWQPGVTVEVLLLGTAAGLLGVGLLAIGWLGRVPALAGQVPYR